MPDLTSQDRVAAIRKTENLKPGDECEFRFPARKQWHPATVVQNGRAGYWRVRNSTLIVDDSGYVPDRPAGTVVSGLYIEHVRAPGTDPWSF